MWIVLRYSLLLAVLTCKLHGQACLNYSTFFGRKAFDEIKGICSDPQKNVYVLGNTYNADLPVTSGAFQQTLKGGYESFLVKFDSCGNLVWCTYFGTSNFDNAEKITYSSDNTIVFCGYTNGTDLNTTSNAFQQTNEGLYDCYIAKFDLNGQPVWISYFGSSNSDFAYDIVTDSLNNIVIGGTTLSDTLYTNTNSFQQINKGSTDAFIARLNSNGNVKFSTFYGGNSSEDIHALAVDRHSNIIGVGGSFSNNLNTSAGCYQPNSNGGMDIYVIKLDSTGQRKFSTYIGDIGTDDAYGVCADRSDYIYVSGHTNSSNFYTSPGAFQSAKAGGNDCYCLSLSPSGNMVWSTFIGGSGNDFMNGMHINSNKELVLHLSAQASNFPMLGIGNNTVNSGGGDAVVIKFLTNGIPFWSTFSGGSAAETPYAAVSVSPNKVILAGTTTSADHPVSAGAYQSFFQGTADGFVTCLSVASSSLATVNELEDGCQPFISYNSIEEVSVKGLCFSQSQYIIYNIIGQYITSGELSSGNISIADLSPGIYILNVFAGERNYSSIKIIRN
jgi:hypothetical protein